MPGRSIRTEAVVLRSIRFGEADRVLHLYTLAGGRMGAVAKGVRKTKSRFGGRLEPLSHVELHLHQGSGELGTITGVDLIRPHARTREEPYRLGGGLGGAEGVVRLFAAAVRRAGGHPARVRGADAVPRPPRRAAEPCPGATRPRPARALVPAEAALARRVPAARDGLRGVRRHRGPRRLLGPRGRSRL